MVDLNRSAARREQALWDLIVAPSKRGMNELRGTAGACPFGRAARALLAADRPVAIATGFPIGGPPETDGPPGAFAIHAALAALGHDVLIGSWAAANAIFASVYDAATYVDIPVDDNAACLRLPGHALVAIEVCGRAEDGTYRNMRHVDISHLAPRFEDCFGDHALVAIGDGGNEYGMGNVDCDFVARWDLIRPVATASHLLPGITSNYAAYALVRALEWETGRELLPDPARHVAMIESLVAMGCVDGVSGQQVPLVDGIALEETFAILDNLKTIA